VAAILQVIQDTLYTTIVLQRGLSYTIVLDNRQLYEMELTIDITCNPKYEQQTIFYFFDVIMRLIKEGFSESEIDYVKNIVQRDPVNSKTRPDFITKKLCDDLVTGLLGYSRVGVMADKSHKDWCKQFEQIWTTPAPTFLENALIVAKNGFSNLGGILLTAAIVSTGIILLEKYAK